jgi:hypothetical protein
MSRRDESAGRMPNPSQYFLEWNSEAKTFCYYSTESEQKENLPLPLRFMALKMMLTVTGYNKERQQGIYANEVTDTRYEELRVAYRDNAVIGKGLYSSIKHLVRDAGGHYTRSIYAMTTKGVIVNIRLRGNQMMAFKEIEKFGKRYEDEWIQVSEFETRTYEEPNGELKEYTVPIFSFAGTLSPADELKTEKNFQIVKQYFISKQYTAAPPQHAAPAQEGERIPYAAGVTPMGDDDDLPF